MENKFAVDKEFMRLIPPLSEEEYRQLEQNIRSNGKLLNPIILWDGVIVDGHNRFYICMEHGIEFEVKDMHFGSRDEAKLWILENQLGRRNLTDVARIELALRKEEMLKALAKEKLKAAGGDKYGKKTPLAKSPENKEEPVNVRESLANVAGISGRTLAMYMKVSEQGSPALIEAVKNGELKISKAYRMLPSQIEKQLIKADKMYDYIQTYLPTIKDEEEKADVRNKLLALREQLVELIERRKTNEVKN